jgi:outer membrane receptor protein involved in Fe transport
MGVTWRGPNELQSRFNGVTDTLHFSPLLAINLRAFADMHRLLPHSAWAKGFRLSLDAVNLTDKRQTVRDSLGRTPLQYQPAYRDPLGRTIEVELRKVF